MKLWIDCETRSPIPIKRGTYRYATQAEVTVISWAIDDGPISVLDLTEGNACQEIRFQNDVRFALEEGAEVWAHNAEFDRTVLNRCALWPRDKAPISAWRCTAYLARLHGLPGGLDKLSTIFKLPPHERKDSSGKDLIQLFCVPRRDGKYNDSHSHPIEWLTFLQYAGQDVVAMRAIHRLCPHWNDTPGMWKKWHLDQRMNRDGFAVDMEFARKAVAATTRAKLTLANSTWTITLGEVESTTQVKMLRAYLAKHGVVLPDLRADTVERRLEDENLPANVVELLRARQQASRSSSAKYQRVLDCEVDGRLRGTIVCCGAQRTGRKAARLFQPHNLPRPKHKQEMIDDFIAFTKLDAAELFCADDIMGLAASSLRGVIVAAPGKRLAVADLSNIEGRGTAWVAGEQWKTDAFRAFDAGAGPDLYRLAYARSFNIKPESVGSEQRQIGKVMELALGYQGGVGAFCTMADTYGIRLEAMAEAAWNALPADLRRAGHDQYNEKRSYGLEGKIWIVCWCLVQLWRRAHPATVRFWRAIENAVSGATRAPDRPITVGRIVVDRRGNWLRLRLPSGRYLCYPAPRLGEDNLSFLGVDQRTRQWGRIPTYGGKLTENIVQALSLDVLDDWLVAAGDSGMNPILSVHDEVICEHETATDKELSALVATCSPWADGLPLVAKGFTDTRYRKAA